MENKDWREDEPVAPPEIKPDLWRNGYDQGYKEGKRDGEQDDLLGDMWGLICNVNGGIIEKEKPEWYEAFLRIREKYFASLQDKLTDKEI